MGGGQYNLFGLEDTEKKTIISVRKRSLLKKSYARLSNCTLASAFESWRDSYRKIVLLRYYASKCVTI